jgi:hypothetical protein
MAKDRNLWILRRTGGDFGRIRVGSGGIDPKTR